MAVETYEFNAEAIASSRLLFPPEIQSDDHVIYHGTSVVAADAIERNGFSSSAPMVPVEQVQAIVAIFDDMKWVGMDQGGYPVLKNFSKYDYQGSESSLLFFADCPMWALTYACRDFAGGEKLRAVRKALADLDDYVEDEQIRSSHWQDLQNDYDFLTQRGADTSAMGVRLPDPVDLGWLRNKLTTLSPLRELANGARQMHSHGVVYAIRIAESDTDFLRWHPSMGIESTREIPPERILGEVIVPRDYEAPHGRGRPSHSNRLTAALTRSPKIGVA